MIKLYNSITKETTKIFHLHFSLMLCVSFKERKGFTETQAVRPWLKIFRKKFFEIIFGPWEG